MKPTLATLVCLFLAACNNNGDHIALGTLERDRVAHTATVSEVIVALALASLRFRKRLD